MRQQVKGGALGPIEAALPWQKEPPAVLSAAPTAVAWQATAAQAAEEIPAAANRTIQPLVAAEAATTTAQAATR